MGVGVDFAPARKPVNAPAMGIFKLNKDCVALNRYSAATPRPDFFCLAGLLRPLLQGFSGILDFGGV